MLALAAVARSEKTGITMETYTTPVSSTHLTDLIRKKKPLSELAFDLIRESPQLMAFSQKDRRVQLGGCLLYTSRCV